ncbi:PP2C family protein-serine/threonine phosphatase [Serpentinicella sp. ANB-PHB4]|uniref:PP2C family protein-serine/threonine phosphatase n=1 Tax=Serpentinicella sp. ANB-PHB4 TaxID=3074076 RepID=UPI00285AF192|nr:PP2C family protein-serine/threonine phosphatase [Serpentinicella sp. ANB-PHB4]MDR5659984.1 PP2C family protein-serine/threonine phosphatase [Serpentinicella sp. ANB-PHB4]
MTLTGFIDVSYHSINKKNEELCGDKIDIIKKPDGVIVVLSDGLGSGVKANILATLTTKIMVTMLKRGESLEETIKTITNTLPICSIRNIGYSTFTVVDIDEGFNAQVIEFDNPPVFIYRDNKLMPIERTQVKIGEKNIRVSHVKLEIGDRLTLCSDGVIHAGVGHILNYGWQWEHVADFLAEQKTPSAEKINRRLIETCNELYNGLPGDDASAVTISIRKVEPINIFTGPPEDKRKDAGAVRSFMQQVGKKIVCGGVAAKIVARELDKEIITSLNYIDPKVPPTADIEGIDLVTEGVLTLKMLLEKLRKLNTSCEDIIIYKEDGVSRLLKLIIEEGTHIYFWVGRAINPAHQNPDFPKDLSIKTRIVNEIIEELRKMGKNVELNYID